MTIFENALEFRYACKKFNEAKIPKEKLESILNSARLAPSSFGLEQWKFIVVQDQAIKEKLAPACFAQPQITTSSDVIVVVGRNDVRKGTDYLEKCLGRFGEAKETMRPIIEGFLDRLDDGNYHEWVSKQCYIAASHIMLSAASLEIDSCPMEGFIPAQVDEILGLGKDFFTSIIIPVGYRADSPRPRQRWDINDLVEYI